MATRRVGTRAAAAAGTTSGQDLLHLLGKGIHALLLVGHLLLLVLQHGG
jgi:hypothetical protein